MKNTRLVMFIVVLLLSLALVGITLAADNTYQQKETSSTDVNSDQGLQPDETGVGASPCALWPGPDGFGYTGQTAAFNWVNITTTGTPIVGLTDDNFIGPIPLGFTLNLYGSPWTEFYAASNGYLTFGSGSTSLSNQCPLPNTTQPNNLIAMLWDDLSFNTSGNAYYQTFPTCPVGTGKCTIVEYYNVAHYGGAAGSAGTWEAIIYENGNVLIQFQDAGAEEGAGSTTGIEGDNVGLDYGLTYACNTATSITDNSAVKFLFPTGIILSPDSVENQGCVNSDVTYTLSLANYTGSDGTFSLSYSSAWPISGPASRSVANGASVDFDVVVSIPCNGVSDVGTVTASGNGYTDVSTLTTSKTDGGFTAWESIAPINGVGRSRPAGAAVAGKVYVLGGEITGGRANTVEEFNPATGNWTTMAGLMPTPASNICAAAIGTDIYIPGGYDASSVYLNTLQVYHTATDAWVTITTDPLPVATLGMGCAAVDGKLYVFGGANASSYFNTAYVYDPAAAAGSRWTSLPNMSYARAYLGGVAVNGKVYAVGGRDSAVLDFAYVEAYDPADGLWHTVTSLNTPRGAPGAMLWGDLLVVCGGGWSSYLNTCEAYDTTQGYAGVWSPLAQTMIQGRRTYAYASLPDTLYAVAGYNGSFLTSAERLPTFTCPACIEVLGPPLNAIQPTDTQTTVPLSVCNNGGMDLTWGIMEFAGIQSVNLPVNPPSQGNSAVAPDSYSPGLTVSQTAGISSLGNRVAIFKDANPWGTTETEAYLTSMGIPYEVHTSAEFGTLDFNQFRMIVFSGDQPTSFYTAYASYVAKFEAYVAQGGFLNFFSCDRGWNVGTLSAPLPGGTTWTGLIYENYNVINDPAHPVVQGVPNPFYGSFASHGHFTNLPASAHVIASEQAGGFPTIVEYPIGDGWFIAYGQPLEISYNWDWEAGRIFANTLLWGYNVIPWLSESPLSGMTPPGECTDIEVEFDSAGMATGNYFGNLVINSNAPIKPSVRLPASLTVYSWGKQAPSDAFTSDTFSYEINIDPVEMVGTAVLTDTIPTGLTFAGNLACNLGTCSYNAGSKAVHWSLAGPSGLASYPPATANPATYVPPENIPFSLSASGSAPLAYQPSVAPQDLLWDQYSPGGAVFAAQDFEPAFNDYDIYAADDFQNAGSWSIEAILTAGGWNSPVDLHNATAIHWFIYEDAGGKPAGVPGDGAEFWSITLPPTDPQVVLGSVDQRSVLLSLNTPINLPPGNWWLVYYASLNFSSYGQYGWQGTTLPKWGVAAQQNNPGGGFGLLPGWNINSYGSDYSFRLEGEIVSSVTISFDVRVTARGGQVVNSADLWWNGITSSASASTEIHIRTIYLPFVNKN
ncbi:MAG: hypothetical protein C3F13_18420 [Anaerolineales bacterium]|nr:hypothetical protein [Anaerolineae bacterium]PWB49814.1 MAG: hypothetical protein C3F13_18420 [Anaerolineales bacterium]